MIENNSVYIPQIDGKDLWIYNYGIDSNKGFTLINSDGNSNLKRYKACLDYSLDLIKLREVYYKIYRNKKFSFFNKEKEYTNRVINVTFEYSVKEYNRTGDDTYIKIGTKPDKVVFNDCVYMKDNIILAIKINKIVNKPLSQEQLGKYFIYDKEKKCYNLNKTIKTVATVEKIRNKLYTDGFMCDEIRYIRWKRSSGSARVGKCLFIDENLYKRIHKWESCNLDIKENNPVDLAAFESYISLTSSSIIDTIEIKPENILIIDDYESVFNDNVISVEEKNGELVSIDKNTVIKNSIWDGQGLIDKSIMGDYQNKGMLLLRNRFFKCCCFNSNIQKWFQDNNITDISQLNGFTLAKNIEDIKLITTPSSIKYLKFDTLENWFNNIDSTFGIVKYEKPTHYFNGKLVQSHYQLINTIMLNEAEIQQLLQPTFDLMTLIKQDAEVLKYWIQFNIENEIEITPVKSKTDVIYKMLSINNKFINTKMYDDFKTDFLKSFTKNLKCGHVLIEGNYSTLCGNPIEMLLHSIGKFNGESQMGIGNVFSKRFKWNSEILGSRSPHITFSNVLITNNKYNKEIDTYLNSTQEIIYINSINENILQKLAGCDMDSDAILVSDNKILINATKRIYNLFKVAVCDVGGNKTQRFYNNEQKCDLDIKTSKNLIGEIINESQELNTIISDMIYKGCNIESQEIQDIYLDVCKLSIMSGIEIDKAKKEFIINNQKELNKIRIKYKNYKNDKQIKPYFFSHLAKQKGYYNGEKKCYLKHHTSMDYLQTCINSFRLSRENKNNKKNLIPFSEVVNMSNFNYDNVYDKQVVNVLNQVEELNNNIKAIYADNNLNNSEKHILSKNIRQDFIESIGQYKFNTDTMIALLKSIEKEENKKYKRLVFYTLFGYPNTSFYEVIINNKENIKKLVKNINGEITIFGEKFAKK